MKSLKGIASLAFIALLAFSVAGCGLIPQKAVEKTTGVKVDENRKSVTATGDNGETAPTSAKEAKLPDGLPTDVPVYAGTISNPTTMTISEVTGYGFTIETGDDIATIIAWYKKQLADKGWTITSTANPTGFSDFKGIQAKKGEKTDITLGVGDVGGKTTIVVNCNVAK